MYIHIYNTWYDVYIYYLISVSSYVYTLYIVLNSCWLYVCNFLLQTVHHFPLFWSNQHHGFDSGQSATRWAAATCTTALPSFRWAEESGGGLPGDKKGCQVCRLEYPMVNFQRWGRRFEIAAPEPKKTITGWWFQIYFFTPIWGRLPFWRIFFRWVETTNQNHFF